MNLTLTVDEAAELMHIGANNVRGLIERGELPAARLGKSFVMVTDQVMDFLREEAVRQTQERRNNQGGGSIPSIPTRRGRRRRLDLSSL
jgi:excisionase family DNA binding protein